MSKNHNEELNTDVNSDAKEAFADKHTQKEDNVSANSIDKEETKADDSKEKRKEDKEDRINKEDKINKDDIMNKEENIEKIKDEVDKSEKKEKQDSKEEEIPRFSPPVFQFG